MQQDAMVWVNGADIVGWRWLVLDQQGEVIGQGKAASERRARAVAARKLERAQAGGPTTNKSVHGTVKLYG